MRVALGPIFQMLFLASLLAFIFALFFVGDLIHRKGERECGIEGMKLSKENTSINISRKLLQSSEGNKTKRMGIRGCSKGVITIHQGQVSPLPSGIPSYAVEIMNLCASDCSISDIHLHCGWFSSARLINPKLFRRLRYDDCLVNDGDALPPAKSLAFQYANTFPYPLSVSSLVCLPP